MFDRPSASPQPDPTQPNARSGMGAPKPADPAGRANQTLLREILNRLTYLQDITSADELGYYLHGIERLALDRGQRLYSQGERVERVYLILSGTVDELRTRTPVAPPTQDAANAHPSAAAGAPVATESRARDATRDEFLLRKAGPSTLLGLFDLVDAKPHSSSARTATECEFIVLEAAQIHRLLYRHPELRSSMLPAARIDRLRTMPLLAGADNVSISYVADAAALRTCVPGESIYQAGESADRVFLIDEGQVRLDYGDLANVHTVWLGNGGDLGYGTRPVAAERIPYELDHNAVAVSVVRLLVVPRQTFVAATGIMPEVEGARLRQLRTQTLDNTGVFKAWSAAERARLLGFVSHYFLPSSHLLTQQGDIADSLWVLLPGGNAVVHTVGPTGVALPDVRMQGPGFFNEDALRTQYPAASTLEAAPDSAWLRLHWMDFNVFLQESGRKEMAEQLQLGRQAQVVAQSHAQRRYRWLANDEIIRHEVRRHWIVALASIAPAIVLTILFGWLLVLVLEWQSGSMLAWVAVGALGVMTLGAWFWGIVDYTNDYLIVTNLRVVRQEKIVLVNQKLQAAPLEKIQDVNLNQDVWGVYLGFADLEVQTPGPGGNIHFDRVADFDRVAKEIQHERDLRRRHYQASGKQLIYQVLENRFGATLALPNRVLGLELSPGAAALPPAPAGLEWLAWLTGGMRRNPLTGRLQSNMAVVTPGAPGTQPAPAAAATAVRTALPAAPAVARNDERHVWHKHWFVLVRVGALPTLALIATLSLAAFFYISAMNGALVILFLFLASASAGWLAWNVADWHNDVYILDRDQLIDIEQRPLGLQKKKRTAGMRQIVDIRLDVPSPLHYLLNFGNVFVQTAAADGEFTFLNVRNPSGVMETIRRRLDQARQDEERQAARQRAQEFPDWLEVYSRLERRNAPDDSNGATTTTP